MIEESYSKNLSVLEKEGQSSLPSEGNQLIGDPREDSSNSRAPATIAPHGGAMGTSSSSSSSLDIPALSRHRHRSEDKHICGRGFIEIQCLGCGYRRVVRKGSLDRTCPACAKTLYQRIFERYSGLVESSKSLLFLTLTMKPVRDQKPEYVQFLGKCVNKFLHRKRFRHYKGVLATVECKKTKSGFFYYHIHCLIEGAYVPQKEISDAWREISGFPIVHVKRIWRTRSRALRYVLKYIMKGMNFASSRERTDFKASFRGVRFVRSFGEFYDREYREGKHVYFPCPSCGSIKSWVVLDFCDVVDLFEGEPYGVGNGG